MSSDEIKTLFDEVDTSGDGKISTKELGRMFKKIGIKLTTNDVRKEIRKYDKDNSRDIDLEEFRTLMADVINANKLYEEAYQAFKIFDADNDNAITYDEVRNACNHLSKKLTEAEIEEFIKKMDTNRNGVIHFDEFARAYACGL